MSIIKSRKKLLILGLLLLPSIVIGSAQASSADILGGAQAYAPAFYSNKIFFVPILIGLIAGLITGCIGAGGGFIITPALMATGVKGILTVGTDLFHIFAKAIMGTAVHRKLGNVSVPLAIAFLASSSVAGWINITLYQLDPCFLIFLSTLFIQFF